MKFEKYQHVERLGSDEVDGILNGIVHIFPKLDGTNTSVYLNDNGEIEVASRNRLLTPENDNQGVCAYVLAQKKFKDYFAEYPNHRLFGEWLIPNRIKNYNGDAWRKLYIFDVMRKCENGTEIYLPYSIYKLFLEQFDIEYIPQIAMLDDPTEEQVRSFVNQCNFLMQDGMSGEGIVIKNYQFINKYGRTTWAKIVRPIDKSKTKVLKLITGAEIESAIVENFVTPEFVEKEFYKIVNDNGGIFSNKLIGKFLGVTWHTFIVEETFNILRKFHNPKIDFALLNKLVVRKIKEVKPEIFK